MFNKTYMFRYEISFTLNELPVKEAKECLEAFETHLKKSLYWLPYVHLGSDPDLSVLLHDSKKHDEYLPENTYCFVISRIVHTVEELSAMHHCLEGIAVLLKPCFLPEHLRSYSHYICNE